MKRGAGIGMAILLAGCGSSATAPVPPPQPVRPAPPPPIAVYPAPISVPPAPTPPRDQCGAWELQDLIGRPRTDIPVAVDLSRRRVVCSTCPVTMDYRPERMTIEYDSTTNRITRIVCG